MMIRALDHIALAVTDLDRAVEGYRKLLGREPNWLGGDGGARHAWFQLECMALDVIAPHGAGAFGDVIRRSLDEQGEGVWAIAFTVDSVAAARPLLLRRGLRASVPGPTRSTHDDGRRRYWTTTSLDAIDTGGVNILLVDPPRNGVAWPQSTCRGADGGAVDTLDHVVIRTVQPERALGVYGAKLGLDLRVDRAVEAWGARMMFFRCGASVVEIIAAPNGAADPVQDRVEGMAWRVRDAAAARARIVEEGFAPSAVRAGRKPGSQVFTVTRGVVSAPTLMIEQGVRPLPASSGATIGAPDPPL